MKEFVGGAVALIVIVIIIGLSLALFMGVLLWFMNLVSLPGQLAEIESLRRDAALVDEARAEDVIGQVTHWNQTISNFQAYDRTWWMGWTVPDEWQAVELIAIPEPAP